MKVEIVRHPTETTSSRRGSVILIHPNEKRTRIVHLNGWNLWISRPPRPSPLSLVVAAFLFLSQRDGKKISIAAATERTISRSLPGRTDGGEGRQGIPRDTAQAFLGHPLELRTGFWKAVKRRLQHWGDRRRRGGGRGTGELRRWWRDTPEGGRRKREREQ